MTDQPHQPPEEGPNPAEPAGVKPAAPREAELQAKIAELEDQYRRALADLANAHRRFQKERERIGRAAVAGFTKKLLPVLDNMTHSLRAAQEDHDPAKLLEGFRLIEAQTLQVLAQNDIHPIESVGKPFDPEVHHAVLQEATAEQPPGTVIEELARGFIIDGLVIRPAQVKVAVAPTGADSPE